MYNQSNMILYFCIFSNMVSWYESKKLGHVKWWDQCCVMCFAFVIKQAFLCAFVVIPLMMSSVTTTMRMKWHWFGGFGLKLINSMLLICEIQQWMHNVKPKWKVFLLSFICHTFLAMVLIVEWNWWYKKYMWDNTENIITDYNSFWWQMYECVSYLGWWYTQYHCNIQWAYGCTMWERG